MFINSEIDIKIELYIKTIFEYNKKVNIISRKITKEQVDVLIRETILMDRHINNKIIVDAGSGNGILGFPLSIANPSRELFLVEPIKKKADFLSYAQRTLDLQNVTVVNTIVEKFIKDTKKKGFTLVARGFPDNLRLLSYLKKKVAYELLILTSDHKIKKIEKKIEKLKQNIYNVPFRDNLKLIHIKNVSRET